MYFCSVKGAETRKAAYLKVFAIVLEEVFIMTKLIDGSLPISIRLTKSC
jgi:hypothetical protein